MEHLPECPTDGVRCSDGSLHGPFEAENSGRCLQCGGVCICGALRACEQRVLNDAVSARFDMTDLQVSWYQHGYAAALDAAAQIVEQMPRFYGVEEAQGDPMWLAEPGSDEGLWIDYEQTATAIRGLREEK